MYNFIFNWMYRYHKQGGNIVYRGTAALAVGITVLFHIFLLIKIILVLMGRKFTLKFSDDYYTNKTYWMPFMFLFFCGFLYYYSHKRAIKIVYSYSKEYKLHTLRNYILISVISILPLLMVIWLTNSEK